MADFATQIKEIETWLSSRTREEKSFGYLTLLHLQEQSTVDPSAIQALSERFQPLLSLIMSDLSDDDEEIAAPALKCLGFMIYHPSLVAAIPEHFAKLILDSLVKLVTTTKIKAICNLAVWCISIQQISASFLTPHFQSLLRAIVHALDNPMGSLSVTFEAIQVLVVDIKQRLLPGMKEGLQNHGMKVPVIQAWGWIIRLLGPYATRNRHMVNEMLKIPEQTFSDPDTQVQIASLVAWEGLVGALIQTPKQPSGTNTTLEQRMQQTEMVQTDVSKGHSSENQANALLKSVKLIMTPLVGIMSSKCDTSVHSSCLNTWFYLLHKLSVSVNCLPVLKTVLEPILEVVFRVGPNSKSIWIYNSCLDLLDECISAKSREVDCDLENQVGNHLPSKVTSFGTLSGGKLLCKNYVIKWLPWDLSMLDFHLKMIHIIISQGSMETANPENASFACSAAMRIFRSVLKEVQIKMRGSSINYNDIMLCLNKILVFTKRISEELISKEFGTNDLLQTSLHFMEAVREEVEPLLLTSPLYRVALDIDYINGLQSISDIKYTNIKGIKAVAFMDMVSPMVYLTTLYFSVVAQSISTVSKLEIILHEMQKLLNFLLSSCYPLENLHAIISLLYKHRGSGWLKIWLVIAEGLKEHLVTSKDLSVLKTESDGPGYVVICWFLCYPFVVCSWPQKQSSLSPIKNSGSSELCLQSTNTTIELERVIEMWRSLYGCINCSSYSECSTMSGFTEEMSATLLEVFNESISMLEVYTKLCPKDKNQILLSLFGEVTIYVLEQILVLDAVALKSRVSNSEEDGEYDQPSNIKNSMEFIARFLKVSHSVQAVVPAENAVISRLFSALACFLRRLHLKKDILLFMEVITAPMVQWLSYGQIKQGSMMAQLQLLWTETLNGLQRTWPPIIFDSSFLKVQAPLLEKTLDHHSSTISDPTIVFWNSTYGNQVKLDYPQSLLPVLDKLSRNGKISIHRRNPRMLVNGHSGVELIDARQRYKVASTQKRSKRVEFIETTENDFDCTDKPTPGLKRKTVELTEHQKEVRRAQQGRERNCNGHGPGIRTYTSVDFSQGNEDSQESQELRNPESILEMLRRTG
ncbi:PREDICTED: uncharacterized protein LOC104592498 isoform X2 [Nelumbo nucifera]|uniref:Uncharacterized protein LOC104592498 isoform X2 n=1 Tax=Nelumbo nucifera TaxID=4432 RepID=A0A1U8Q0T6_NELNU|nr:PREDICTED: uncharacterized protein LOC104592498 isoform X2 [Nelumbo nucifera]